MTLDAAKAFDVVWQGSLLRKIYLEGVDGCIWLTLLNMYTQATSSVRWGQGVSAPFPVKQGVRQGGILSTIHYKLFNNDLLHVIEESGIRATIGCLYCGAPTCADDVAALGGKMHAQCIVTIVRWYCGGHRYCIHPQKSEEVPMNKDDKDPESVMYGEEPISKVQSAVHLGVHMESTGRPDIQKKVQLGRRTMYSMMGAGVCGGSGLNPIVSSHLWKIYVVPRVLYGLEILSLTLADLTALERLQREMLRKLQSLTRSIATVAVTCLLGIRPLENELDLRRLTLLCNVLFTDGTLEQYVALCQIAVKDADNHSWFTACNRLLHKYNLPNIYVLKEQFSSEDKCKAAIKVQVDSLVSNTWCTEAATKSTLKYLNVKACKVVEPHPCWRTVTGSTLDVKRAVIKVRLLTGTYYLQKDRAKFKGGSVTDLCLLCSAATEDRVYFIAECGALSSVRLRYLAEIENELTYRNHPTAVANVLYDKVALTQLVLDCASAMVAGKVSISSQEAVAVERITRRLCFALHLKSCELLGQL